MSTAAAPRSCIFPPGLVSPASKLVWLYLNGPYGAKPGQPFRFNVDEAQRDLGMSDRAIRLGLRRMEDVGLVTWQRSKGGHPNYDGRCGLVTITWERQR